MDFDKAFETFIKGQQITDIVHNRIRTVMFFSNGYKILYRLIAGIINSIIVDPDDNIIAEQLDEE